jgi:hypothetical protein
MNKRKSNGTTFRPGRKKTGGRKKGSANKLTREISEAILEAGERVGYDGKGRGGLTGLLQRLAMTHPPAYASLLGRLLPMKFNAAMNVSIRSKEDVIRELKQRHIPVTHIFDQAPIPVLELEPKKVLDGDNNAQEH